MRVAQRRKNPAFLASKVAAKYPAGKREQIYNYLLEEKNWYIPYFDLPENSPQGAVPCPQAGLLRPCNMVKSPFLIWRIALHLKGGFLPWSLSVFQNKP